MLSSELSPFAQRSATNLELWNTRLETLKASIALSPSVPAAVQVTPPTPCTSISASTSIPPRCAHLPSFISTVDHVSDDTSDEPCDCSRPSSSSSSSTPPQSARTSWTAPSSAHSSLSSLFAPYNYTLDKPSASSPDQRCGTYGLRLTPEQSGAGAGGVESGMDALRAAYDASGRRGRRSSRASDTQSRRSSWHVVGNVRIFPESESGACPCACTSVSTACDSGCPLPKYTPRGTTDVSNPVVG